MLGDTVTVKTSAAAVFPDLPDSTAGDVTLSKVNQDNFGAEYRFLGAAGRYILRVRNSTEPATLTRPLTNRHNVELTYVAKADPLTGVPERTYVAYVIARFPPSGDTDVAGSIFESVCQALTGAQLTKIMNFES
jgi:hypothetical protein